MVEKNLSFLSEDFFKYPSSKQYIKQNDIPVSGSRPYTEYLVEFTTESRCAVGMVDMVNSSKISAQIGPKKSARYYQVFLNSMSKILSKYDGIVIKNVGDCLFYYFPDSDNQEQLGLARCIECSLEMIRSQKYISEQLVNEGLPKIDFRISADYGTVLFMKTSISESLDMIGLPVNMCSKINRLAEKNQFVIGGDFFQLIKEFKTYQFKEITDFSLGFKLSYPVYLVLNR